MKRSELWWGIGTAIAGAVLLVSALLWETALGSLQAGFAGALLWPGIVQIYRYQKWNRPENAEAYREMREQAAIDARDERKEALRNRAGRYAYLLSVLLCAVAIPVISVWGNLGNLPQARALVLVLSVYLIIQLGAGYWFYWKLSQKY